MAFLLRRLNAIDHTRAGTRTRNALRFSASGIAFAGCFAVCLLLAGFLSVSSVTAQINVLRMGGGAITVPAVSGQEQVRSFRIGTADAVIDPTDQGGTPTTSFLVGGHALVNVVSGALTVTPIAPGAFKITVAGDATAPIGIGNPGTTHEFEIVSANAPMLRDIGGAANAYNAGVQVDMEDLELMPRDNPSEEYPLTSWFTDPNEVFITYTAEADTVGRGEPDGSDGESIIRATISDNDLTVVLTSQARMGDATDVWVFARDGSGEYARKRIQVTIGAAINPYVDSPLADVVLRENAGADTVIDLTEAFDDPENFTDINVRDPGNADATALTYAVSIDDSDAAMVGTDNEFSWVTSYMTAKVVLTDVTGGGVGHSGATVTIRPRAPGSTTFTVTATDRGRRCRSGFTFYAEDTFSRFGGPTGGEPDVDRCIEDSGNRTEADSTGLYSDAKSVKDVFILAVVTRTSPMPDTPIGARTVVADGDVLTFDLEDLNGDADGELKAFSDPTNGGLTYTLEPKDAIATITADGSVVTITPVWRADTETTRVKVTATNTRDETSFPAYFDLTVETAREPIVNQHPAVQAALAAGFSLRTGAAPLVVHLRNLTGAERAVDYVPLFIDPNVAEGDALPGGLLFSMGIDDVVAEHVYAGISRENDVYTSAMRLVLDPVAATLTVTPTAANSATVMVSATDREGYKASATTTITVVSCDGVDMSDPCQGVTTGAEGAELPTEVELSQNYPNPFNPQTTIDYALPQAGDVSLVVYDMLGREVDVLMDGPQAAGRHTVRFGANHLPNGTYVYRLIAGDKTITRTMVLVK
ncbi:MAG: T9SS type A sorting domain-containing protein [Bacteroidetes bacterium SB0668_bin_1]|nr:T9SS type A sorting domain-containing protein [Bacteroidetes bacterium SB0668_bin_1]